MGKIKATCVAAIGKPITEIAAVGGIQAARTGTEVAAAGGSAAGRTGLELATMGATAATHASLFNMTLLGGFGVLSAITNQIEYKHERAEITNFYREELAAKNHKNQNQVNDGDLTRAENENATIKGAVTKERNYRNLGIAASFVASVAVYALMHTVAMPIAIGMTAAFAAKVTVGVLAYLAIKKPLVDGGTLLLGLKKPDAHDKIREIAKDHAQGRGITREQVVEVFIAANKDIAGYVKNHFGRDYDELSLSDKVRVADEFSKYIPVDKITHSINLGMTNASELAYTVEGDMSGVLPRSGDKVESPSRIAQFAQKCKQMMHSVTGMFGAEKADPIAARTHIEGSQQPDIESRRGEESPFIEMNKSPKDQGHEKQTQSYVDRLGLQPTKDYARRVAEEAVMMDGPRTIQ